MRVLLLILSLVCGNGMFAADDAAQEAEMVAQDPTKLYAVTTSWWITEWVKIVGGDNVDVTPLVDEKGDLHAYTPTPSDMRMIEAADIIFANGLGLEPWLKNFANKTVYLGDLVLGHRDRQVLENKDLEHELEYRDTFVDEDGHAVELEHDHHHHEEDVDPHVWLSPVKAAGMVRIITETLTQAIPDKAVEISRNGDDYRILISRLDQEVSAKMHRIPLSQRKLVTGHNSFGYFAERYGFNIEGSVVGGHDSHASTPSARDMMSIIRIIRNEGIPCIFEDAHVQSGSAENIAKEAQIPLYRLHTATAVEDTEEGQRYIETMRQNAETIAEGLAQ